MGNDQSTEDTRIIEPSGGFDVVVADDLSVLLQDDMSTINLYEDVPVTQSNKEDTDMDYLKSFKLLRLAVKIPTKKLRILNALLSDSLVYLKDNQRIFVYGKDERQAKPETMKIIDAGKTSIVKSVSRIVITAFPEKDETIAGEDFIFHGRVFDLASGQGIADTRVWLAIDDDEIIGVTSTDKDGNFQYKVSGTITAKEPTIVALAPNIGESEVFKFSFRIKSV